MNEPYGYTLDRVGVVTRGWLAQHTSVPRGRVVISGTGYNDNVTGVGAAPELRGHAAVAALLRLLGQRHQQADWAAEPRPGSAKYAGRTIIDEAGSPMTIGLNYGTRTATSTRRISRR